MAPPTTRSPRGRQRLPLSPGGAFINIVSCTGHNCLHPIALITGADGNVYGISEGDQQEFGNNGQPFAITYVSQGDGRPSA